MDPKKIPNILNAIEFYDADYIVLCCKQLPASSQLSDYSMIFFVWGLLFLETAPEFLEDSIAQPGLNIRLMGRETIPFQ